MTRRRLVQTATAAALAAVVLAACTDRPLDDVVREDVPPPPSVRTDEQAPGAAVRVRLSRDQRAQLGLRTRVVGRETAAYVVSLPGEVAAAPENFSQVSAPISGRVVAIHAHEGEAVRQGAPLVALESIEFANIAADYLQAVAEEAYQQRQVERLGTLVERKISPRSRLERAEADLSRARSSTSATYARLRALGITDAQIEGWSTGARERPLLQLHAPISGVIDRHLIDLGQSVTAYQELLTIIDTRRVLVRGFVSPDDAPFIRPGDTVVIGVKGAPDRQLRARVTTVNPSVDPENRSVTVNVVTPTRAGWPMPGQTVRMEITSGDTRPVLSVPLSALQYEGEQPTVFVRVDSLTFEARPVAIDRITQDEAILTGGVAPGEEVAISQVFSLKALGRFDKYAD